ncbi:MAG: hypothetical protein DI598_05095 [Pseudopedobacter saltans]|uniref:TonB-dependent receptor plug domain-containing protein n=1 Tax=Pseudopedobacter saltans TaxID=151895 RepID=A0A2W5F765_9SPHI|nr:MAG: hypothetical protein DI598_05095 [Pseudopedobacter saltans]
MRKKGTFLQPHLKVVVNSCTKTKGKRTSIYEKIFSLFVVTLLMSFCVVLGQRVSIHAKDEKLTTILKQIEKQSNHYFIYINEWMQQAKPVNVNFDNLSLKSALEVCFENQPFTYEIQQSTIPLKLKKNDKEQSSGTDILSGVVSDSIGTPIDGVVVTYSNGKYATITNSKGVFTLKNIDLSKALLKFHSIGYSDASVSVDGRNNISVVLNQQTKDLDSLGVVINTGYQRINRERMTGAVSTLSAKDFNSRVNTDNILDGMQGRLAGVLINNDIQFQGGNLFQVRGLATMSGNSSPLIVVDGYPTTLSINQINPNEIETITVLKDAAAASIYGTRASNGVIVITRIKGAKGNVSTQFTSTLSIKPPTNYSKYKFAPSNTYLNYNYERAMRGQLVVNPNSQNIFLSGLQPIVEYNRGNIDSMELVRQIDEIGSYDNAKEYANLFLRPSTNQQYYLNISGSSDNVNYFISGSFSKRALEAKKNGINSSSISSRLSIRFNKKLSLDINEDLNYNVTKTAPIPDYMLLAPYERLADDQGNGLPVLSLSTTNPYYNATQITNGYIDNMVNPYEDFKLVKQNTNFLSNRISARINYTIRTNLRATVFSIFEFQRQQLESYYPEKSSQARTLINFGTEPDGYGGLNHNIPKGGGYNAIINTNLGSFTTRAQVNYDPKIGNDHYFNLIVGAEVTKAVSKSSSTYLFGYDDNTLRQLPIDFSYLANYGGGGAYSRFYQSFSFSNALAKTYSDNRTISGYSNLMYTFKSKYTLSASARVDQSNLFGTNKKYKYKPLWSVGANWQIDKENFLKDNKVITALRLRASSGFNGNVSKNSIPDVIGMYSTNGFTLDYLSSINITNLANTQLRWETTYNFNVGTDWTFYNKWNLSIDYYRKNSKDVLGPANIDPTYGTNSAILNSADIRNNGFEFSLHADWITHAKFNWNTGLNLSLNSNKVKRAFLANIYKTSGQFLNNPNASLFMEGYPASPMFAYNYAGLDDNGFPLVYDKSNNPILIGQYPENIADTGRALLNYMGSTIPQTIIGLSNRFDIGRFYVYTMLNLYTGFKRRIPALTPNTLHPLEGADNYFRNPGDQANTNVFGFYYGDLYNNNLLVYNYASSNVINGSYLTLNDVTFGYSLSDKLVKPIGLSNCSIKFQATNVWTVGFNKYNTSLATGNFAKRYLTPTYTIGIFTNL